MSGDDLTDLDLIGANLTGDLTFAWIVRANFAHARLHSATMQTVVTSTEWMIPRIRLQSLSAQICRTHRSQSTSASMTCEGQTSRMLT